jgi:hypothetical protein
MKNSLSLVLIDVIIFLAAAEQGDKISISDAVATQYFLPLLALSYRMNIHLNKLNKTKI